MPFWGRKVEELPVGCAVRVGLREGFAGSVEEHLLSWDEKVFARLLPQDSDILQRSGAVRAMKLVMVFVVQATTPLPW